MLLETERRELVIYGKRMLADKLVTLTSGNISIYDPETGYMAVTPSGIPYDETAPQDIVVMTLDGKIVDGSRKPSSENRLHAAVYKARPHARAVVHTHSMFATTLGIAGEEVKAVHFLLPDLMGRGNVPLVPYVTYGTEALAERVREAMKDSPACLLQNHGMVASGRNIACGCVCQGIGSRDNRRDAVESRMHREDENTDRAGSGGNLRILPDQLRAENLIHI